MTPGIFRRLKLPMGPNMLFVQNLVKLHLRPIALVKEVTDSAVRRLLYEAGNDIDGLMKLCRADITSKNPDKVTRYLRNFEQVEKKMVELEEKDKIRNFQPPVTGDEIIRWFNLTPGPIVGEIKEQIKDAILDGVIRNDRDEAIQYMIGIGREKGLPEIQIDINS